MNNYIILLYILYCRVLKVYHRWLIYLRPRDPSSRSSVCVCKCYFPASQGKALICRMVSSETFWTRWSLICLWNLSNKHLCICSIAIIMFMWSMNPINCQTSPEHHVGAKCNQIWYGVAISRWVAIHIFSPKKNAILNPIYEVQHHV